MADGSHWGSSPKRTSYLFDAMLRLSYFLGNYYPVGSSQQFANDLGKALEQRGGKVLKCVSVEKILVEGGKATGVRVRTVSKRPSEYYEFRAPVVVSNGDALHTYRDLIGEEHCGRWLIEHMESLRPSHPCFLIHIGLRGMDQKRLTEVEGYYWNSHEPDDVTRNVFKIFTTTRFDPSLAPPGCQILIVQKVTPTPFDKITDWQAHKAFVENYLMSRVRQILPGIDDHIVVKTSASAMTSFHFTGNWQGAMLGWEMSPEQLGSSRLPNSTPIENLYSDGTLDSARAAALHPSLCRPSVLRK